VKIELPDIAPQARRAEADLYDESKPCARNSSRFCTRRSALPAIRRFGEVWAPALPRHADAALWLPAAAPALALEERQVLAALDRDDAGPILRACR
jgi:hypothetical protein